MTGGERVDYWLEESIGEREGRQFEEGLDS